MVLTNAAGGLDPGFEPGELMLVTDHINLSGDNPLFGPNIDALGPASRPSPTPTTRNWPLAPALRRSGPGPPARGGLRDAFRPEFRDRAELRVLRAIGGDAVGMSTALEVIVARHAGVEVLAISLITNKATPDVTVGATHEEVIEMGRTGARPPNHPLRTLLPEIA